MRLQVVGFGVSGGLGCAVPKAEHLEGLHQRLKPEGFRFWGLGGFRVRSWVCEPPKIQDLTRATQGLRLGASRVGHVHSTQYM